jgi:hypothetical protein
MLSLSTDEMMLVMGRQLMSAVEAEEVQPVIVPLPLQ